MDKLKMHTPDIAEENYKKLAALFPDAITESKDEDGNTVRAIDKDVLMQEINTKVIDDGQERYQFTWPDKRKSMVMANAPIAKTLRLEKEKSVGRDGTPGGVDSKNIYIEGDNLDALKLLQETYLGKVKMIYIDPPYNTGNDFIYEDDFAQSADEYVDNSGQTDEEGNRLVQNSESNGRYHTDWLNMMYPRIKLARDLLAENGIIFISMNDSEIQNLKKICDEIFGQRNEVATLIWDKNHSVQAGIYKVYHEYILAYAKNIYKVQRPQSLTNDIFEAGAVKKISSRHPASEFTFPVGTKFDAPDGTIIEGTFGGAEKITITHGRMIAKNQKLVEAVTVKAGFTQLNQMKQYFYGDKSSLVDSKGQKIIEFYLTNTGKVKVVKRRAVETPQTTCRFGTQGAASNELAKIFGLTESPFSSPKPVAMIKDFIKRFTTTDDIIMDFFSGSATTAHAVMDVNSENSRKKLKYILVQLQENIDIVLKGKHKDADTTAKVAIDYLNSRKLDHTVCSIGEERIRLVGKKIKEETGVDIDYGFRCFKVDSSNMKDVYYAPADIEQLSLDGFEDNIKEDRTPEDLLIQVMLDLGILLSSDIETQEIAGKKVFSVADGYLLACFDKNVTEKIVTEIAKKKPFYAVFRDSSMVNDSVAANFEQIFETYSPETVRKVL